MTYRADDPNLAWPEWVNGTPDQMWEAQQFVAGVLGIIPELVTDAMVWAYRAGKDPREVEFDEEDIAKVEAMTSGWVGKRDWNPGAESEEDKELNRRAREGRKKASEWGVAAEDLI